MKKTLFYSFIVFSSFTFFQCSAPAEQNEEAEVVEVAPVETFEIATMHQKVWQEAVKQIIELAEAMPEDQYSFKPHDSVMTFAEQLIHIAQGSNFVAHKFLKDTPPPQSEKPDPSTVTKEELIAFVNSQLNEVEEVILSCSDQKLKETVKSFSGQEFTRMEGLFNMHDHLTNHKAKANLYIRISGNEPPAYRYY